MIHWLSAHAQRFPITINERKILCLDLWIDIDEYLSFYSNLKINLLLLPVFISYILSTRMMAGTTPSYLRNVVARVLFQHNKGPIALKYNLDVTTSIGLEVYDITH